MANKKHYKVAITQMTKNGAYVYGGFNHYSGEVTFSPTFNHCYFNGITLKKIKGGRSGGNYECIDSGEVYRVMKFEKLEKNKERNKIKNV